MKRKKKEKMKNEGNKRKKGREERGKRENEFAPHSKPNKSVNADESQAREKPDRFFFFLQLSSR